MPASILRAVRAPHGTGPDANFGPMSPLVQRKQDAIGKTFTYGRGARGLWVAAAHEFLAVVLGPARPEGLKASARADRLRTRGIQGRESVSELDKPGVR